MNKTKTDNEKLKNDLNEKYKEIKRLTNELREHAETFKKLEIESLYFLWRNGSMGFAEAQKSFERIEKT